MTRREKVAAFLRERGQEGAGNGEIMRATGVTPLALVFNITSRMMARGDVRGRRIRDTGRWHFVWRRET
jgi:hypothetical protein